MLNTFFKTSFTSARTDLRKTLPSVTELMPYSPYSVYLFGVNDSSLNSVISDKKLIAKSPSTTTYDADSVIVTATTGKHLESSLLDSDDVTVVGVATNTSATLKPLVGNLQPRATGTGSSWGVFLENNLIYLTVRPTPTTDDINSINMNASLTVGQPFTFGISLNKTTKKVIFTCSQNGVVTEVEKTFTTNYAKTGLPLSLGDIAYSTTGTGTIKFKEATVYDKALTLIELRAATLTASNRHK